MQALFADLADTPEERLLSEEDPDRPTTTWPGSSSAL